MRLQNYLFAAVFAAGFTVSVVFSQNTEMYYCLPLRQIEIEGQWPDKVLSSPAPLDWGLRQQIKYYLPYAAGDRQEEIYIDFGEFIQSGGQNRPDFWRIQSVGQLLDNASVAIKSSHSLPITGIIFLPTANLKSMSAVRFRISKEPVNAEQTSAKRHFFTAMKNHYTLLQSCGFTGTEWFAYRAKQAQKILDDQQCSGVSQQGRLLPEQDPFEDIMLFFTGRKAVMENIQLDRTLQTRFNEPRVVDIAGIEGITTSAIDWNKQNEGIVFKKDALARFIPADQHALFYPTFKSMMHLLDRLKGTWYLPDEFQTQNIESYERQMCVWLDGWSRFWGPKTIASVALTGSDLYWKAGTDSAVLFDAPIARLVYSNTESKQQEALEKVKDAKKLTGMVSGILYQAVVSPDRTVSSYLARLDNAVIVSNSLVQLEKIIKTAQGKQPSLAEAGEYAFFRSCYPADENRQTAFLVLTDAAIRRWCSPRWRIGAARRMLVSTVLSQLQAGYLDNQDRFDLAAAQTTALNWAPDIGDITITNAGITSSVYGNLRFMTPISELAIEKATERERNQYNRFRSSYQSRWRTFFDPVAAAVLLESDTIDIDITIRPLIADSEYRQLMQIGGKNFLQPDDGDPHAKTILQAILAIDSDSEPVRLAGGFARPMGGPEWINTHPLSWLGRWITIYAEEDSFWGELAGILSGHTLDYEFFEYLEQNINRLPLAAAMDVDSPSQLTIFLVGLRAFIEQTAPNMTVWETLNWQQKSYVKITFQYEQAKQNPPSLYYAALPNQLIITPHEKLLQQAIERASVSARQNGTKAPVQWLGKNLAVQADEKAWKVIEIIASQSWNRYLQMQSWRHLPILAEWRMRKGELSETDFHLRYWHTRLTCPGGGQYVWNEQFHTFESTVFGHPGQPRMPDDLLTPMQAVQQVRLGITFEEDGLRARTVMKQKK